MAKTTIILMLISVFSQITGFVRELVLSYFYGASNISDAFLISLTIPNVFFSIIGRALNTNFIPIYSQILTNEDEKTASKFTSNLLNIMFIISFIIVIICFIFTKEIIQIFAFGFDEETLGIASNMLKWSSLGIFSLVSFNIFSSLLQYNNRHIVSAFSGIVLNTFIIISMICSYYFKSLTILSVGTLLAILMKSIMLFPSLNKVGFQYSKYLNVGTKYLKRFLFLSIPVTLGIAVNQINIIVDRTIASSVAIGGISIINYASKLSGFIYGIFVSSIVAVMYPKIVKQVNSKVKEIYSTINMSITGVLLFVVPSIFGLVIFAEPIILFLYGRGEFDHNAIFITSEVLKYYSIGIFAVSLRLVISKIFYAYQDTKTPIINGTIGIIINIILNILLSKVMGLSGLALATSITDIIITLMLFISLQKIIDIKKLKTSFISAIKIVISSSIMGVIGLFSYNNLNLTLSETFRLFLTIAICIMTYLLSIYVMKVPEVNDFLFAFFKKNED